MKKKVTDAMIDLETMGTEPDSAIVSIGIVLFNPVTGYISDETYYEELAWEDQGRVKYQSCMDNFWKNQDKAVQNALHGFGDLAETLDGVSAFLPDNIIVWGNGATFDISILEHAYKQCERPYPWKFWNINDVRTARRMYALLRGDLEPYKFKGKKHNALDDAMNQTKDIIRIMQALAK